MTFIIVKFPEKTGIISVKIETIDDETIQIHLSRFDKKSIEKMKSIVGSSYVPQTKCWKLPGESRTEMEKYFSQKNFKIKS